MPDGAPVDKGFEPPEPCQGESLEDYQKRLQAHISDVLAHVTATYEAEGEPLPDWIAALKTLRGDA